VVAIAGILLRMFAKKRTSRHCGDILMGFAVLMFGMSVMSDAVSGLGDAAWFTSALTSLSHPLLGILVGALFTALLQSASAAVGIVQALSVTGAVTFEAALPLLMGISIGAAAPVLFSAIGANIDGRRTAFVYLIVTIAGTAVCAAVFYIANAAVGFSFVSDIMNPFSTALLNTLLRLAMLLFLLPFTRVVERAVTVLIPDRRKPGEELPEIRLEERFIAHPSLAVEQSRQTINNMAEIAEKALILALSLLSRFRESDFESVRSMEATVDRYEDSLGTYLIKLTGRELTVAQNEEISEFLHALSDFERISDHALNLAENAQEIVEKKIGFSENAQRELDVLTAAVCQVVSMAVTAFRERDLALAARVQPLEEVIDGLCDQMKLNHVERLQHGVCTISQGFVFNDVVTNCERVSDHCSNIAIAMIELSGAAFQMHEYTHSLREKETPEFHEAYEEYARRFAI